jgi:hypothetical protein
MGLSRRFHQVRASIDTGARDAPIFVHPPARHVARKVTAFRDFLVEHFASYPLLGRSA